MSSQSFSKEELITIRKNFPHVENGHVYLNHAAIAPISKRVKSAIDDFLTERNSGGVENFEHWFGISEQARGLVADYINAPDSNQITFVSNTSEGISAIAEGLEWNAGDEIILNSMEFPSNIQPFRALQNKGVKLNIIRAENNRITPEQIEQAITGKTRMISVSAVQFLHGYRADLKSIGELCKAHNIIFVVDAIQCLGAFRIHVEECHIDALATGGHKWLMSPMGFGFLYISEKLAEKITPFKTGWLSVEEPWDFFNYNQNWLQISKHLEVGTPNMLGITGMGASIQSLFDIGTDRVQEHIMDVTRYLNNQLTEKNGVTLISPVQDYERAGIVSFKIDGVSDPEKVLQNLKEKKITISVREGLFRISPHYYNTKEEIETALGEIF